jgi:hypothetical protein
MSGKRRVFHQERRPKINANPTDDDLTISVMLPLSTGCGRKASSATAEVTPEKATFTIPVEQRSIWRWHLESTPFNAFEYDWTISLNGGRSFGFSVWKNGDQPPKQGNLSQLIAAGQGSSWEATPGGGGRLVGKIGVRAVQQDSAVELVVSEQPILKELLESRPPTVEVVTRNLDNAKEQYFIAQQRYSIAVQYRDR